MTTVSSKSPKTPSERSILYIQEKILNIKHKLASEGVEEQDLPMYMPGVLATNMGLPLPTGLKLPKGLMAKELFDKELTSLIKQGTDSNKSCSDIALQINCVEKLKPIRNVDHQLADLNIQLYTALNIAGHWTAKKIQFCLDFAPHNAKAFYAKITPLLNEYEALADQLKTVRRNLV